MEWVPDEAVLPVLGCVAQAGASVLSVALATVAGSARVLECCTATATGLDTAATAELGTSDNNWRVGRRDQVWIARNAEVLLDVTEVPLPDIPPAAIDLSVLDIGWDVGHVLTCDSWIREQVTDADSLIALTTPTIPGLRRLETTLTLLDPARVAIAVVGAPPRRWARALTTSMGPMTSAAMEAGRIVAVPHDKNLALRGLDSAPLPTSLLRAAETLLQHTAAGDHHQKGNHP